MDKNWAVDNLQTIRTLMERSAIYRRALAPVCTFVGAVGTLAAVAAVLLHVENTGPFAIYWMAIAVLSLGGSMVIVRRQASGEGENFWSPPMRRVTEAMFPALFIGLVLGCLVTFEFWGLGTLPMDVLIIIWTILFGIAVHSAGFFMPRGIRLFGALFMLAGLILACLLVHSPFPDRQFVPHILMGAIFGISHLAYGGYLYLTENRKNAL